MMEATLTEAGRVYAVSHKDNSIVARVALEAAHWGGSTWPETFQIAAIGACNDLGRITVAEAAYLSTYEGGWGLKASEEDALYNIVLAIRPDLVPHGFDNIRDSEIMQELAEKLFEIASMGGDSRETIGQFLPIFDERVPEQVTA
jgi:hypothetical protein